MEEEPVQSVFIDLSQKWRIKFEHLIVSLSTVRLGTSKPKPTNVGSLLHLAK